MISIPVYFSEEMVVNKKQKSPSPGKPREVVSQWQKLGYKIAVKDVHPVSLEQIMAAHDPQFVENIMTGQIENGFETKDIEVIHSLPYTSGSFMDAAKEALHNKRVAVSPTSGFHHATYREAMGYCTFNGLMVSAMELLKTENINRIGILDCDQHYGNGTDDIIIRMGLQDKITHFTARKSYPYDADIFFQLLPEFLNEFLDCDIVFYQAGADCHINDPHGGFLNNEQMKERDHIVFQFCRDHNLPIVWNLAGGYQEDQLPNGETSIQKVLDLHNNTMMECQKVYVI